MVKNVDKRVIVAYSMQSGKVATLQVGLHKLGSCLGACDGEEEEEIGLKGWKEQSAHFSIFPPNSSAAKYSILCRVCAYLPLVKPTEGL